MGTRAHQSCRAWCARWLEAGWHVEAEGKIFRQPGRSTASPLPAESTGSSCTAPWNTETQPRSFRSCWQRCARRDHGHARRRLLRPAAGGVAAPLRPVAGMGDGRGRSHSLPPQPGRRCSMRCWPPSRQWIATKPSRRVRDELRSFQAVSALREQPAGFMGRLRDYQREGLGWMDFLRRFGFRRLPGRRYGRGQDRAGAGPARNAPRVARPRARSTRLRWSWCRDRWSSTGSRKRQRFTPQLRVLDYTGIARDAETISPAYDLVLTTYGTLRRDAAALQGSSSSIT